MSTRTKPAPATALTRRERRRTAMARWTVAAILFAFLATLTAPILVS